VTGETAAAREPLQRALELAPEAPAVLRGVIAMALVDKQPDRARAIARAAQKRRPLEPLGWELEAEVEGALANPKGAALAYRGAFERGDSPERAVLLHRALLASDENAAQQFQQRRLKSAPADAFFIVHLAETAQRAGHTAEAEARYRQALQVQPDNPLVMNNLADLLLQRQDVGALALAQRAASMAPQLPGVLDTLAAAHAQARQHDQAVKVQQRAVALLPGDPTLRLNLASYLLARGDKDAAREQLQHALRPGLPAEQREEAERLRGQLGG
jgi:cellulose synthase operon protein C